MVSPVLAVAEAATRGIPALFHVAWLIPILPLVSFFLIVFFGKKLPLKGAEIGIVAVFVGLVISLGILGSFVGSNGAEHAREISTRWFPFGGAFHLSLGMTIDGLTAAMFCVGPILFV